jgi:hypothetical protein
MLMKGGSTFTGVSGTVYTTGTTPDVGPGDVRLGLINGWSELYYPPSSPNPKQTLLTKIRAGIAAASCCNSVELQPWLPPQNINTNGTLVRLNSTAYNQGTMMLNNAGTHMFCARVAGTTAAAEVATVTTPLVTTAPYNMGQITDGSAGLLWMGPNRTASALANAPILTTGTSPAWITKVFTVSVSGLGASPLFRCFGGSGFAANLLNNQLMSIRGPATVVGSADTKFSGNYRGSSYSGAIEFLTDAPYFVLDLKANGSMGTTDMIGIEVDGRRLFDGACLAVATLSVGNGYLNFDFRSSGGRKARKIRLLLPGNGGGFGYVFTTPQDSVWYPTNPNRYRMVVEGDSITYGSGNGPFIPGWDRVSIFANLVGCDDFANLGVASTGFIANNSGSDLNYLGRLPSVAALQPDVLWINGALNDSASSSSARVAAMLAYLQAARSVMPNTMIFMAGTYGGLNLASNQAIEADQQTAVNQFGDTNVFFVPVSLDTPAWGTGTVAIQGTPTGTGNSETYIGVGDTTHPSAQAIAAYLAFKDATAFRNQIALM